MRCICGEQRLSWNSRSFLAFSTRARKKLHSLYGKNKNIANAFSNGKPRMSNAHCRYVIATGGAIHETREMSKMSSVHQGARSRARECNGMFTAAEHDALIIKGHGYCTDMSATRQELAKTTVIYKPEKILHSFSSVLFLVVKFVRSSFAFISVTLLFLK